jgi:hypothetical protein
MQQQRMSLPTFGLEIPCESTTLVSELAPKPTCILDHIWNNRIVPLRETLLFNCTTFSGSVCSHSQATLLKRPQTWVNDELYDFLLTIDPSKSSLQILWLLPENTHLETKRSSEGKAESERARRGSASRVSEDSDLPLYLAG